MPALHWENLAALVVVTAVPSSFDPSPLHSFPSLFGEVQSSRAHPLILTHPSRLWMFHVKFTLLCKSLRRCVGGLVWSVKCATQCTCFDILNNKWKNKDILENSWWNFFNHSKETYPCEVFILLKFTWACFLSHAALQR